MNADSLGVKFHAEPLSVRFHLSEEEELKLKEECGELPFIVSIKKNDGVAHVSPATLEIRRETPVKLGSLDNSSSGHLFDIPAQGVCTQSLSEKLISDGCTETNNTTTFEDQAEEDEDAMEFFNE